MNKRYDNPRYDAAYNRCINILSQLMMKYGPHVLLKQSIEKITGKGTATFQQQEQPNTRATRFFTYQKLLSKVIKPDKEAKDTAA